jgi:hypothetical protein
VELVDSTVFNPPADLKIHLPAVLKAEIFPSGIEQYAECKSAVPLFTRKYRT